MTPPAAAFLSATPTPVIKYVSVEVVWFVDVLMFCCDENDVRSFDVVGRSKR